MVYRAERIRKHRGVGQEYIGSWRKNCWLAHPSSSHTINLVLGIHRVDHDEGGGRVCTVTLNANLV